MPKRIKLLSAYELQAFGDSQIKAAYFAQGCAAMLEELMPYLNPVFKPTVQVNEETVLALREMIKGTDGDRIVYQAELAECNFVCELPF